MFFVFFHIPFDVYRNSDISFLICFHSFAYGYHIKIGGSVWSLNSERLLCVFFPFISTLRFTGTEISPLWHVFILKLTATASRLGNRFEAQTPREFFVFFHIHFDVYQNRCISSLTRSNSFAYGYHNPIGESVWSSNSRRIIMCSFLFVSHPLWG